MNVSTGPHHDRWTSWLLGALASAVIGACTCMGPGIDAQPYACASDEECASDWLCRRGACVRADAGCAAALEVCDDGLENDCDELIDCADPECQGTTCSPNGFVCQGTDCTCPPAGQDGGLPPEARCDDGLDDDCDLAADCDDPDCTGDVCSPAGLVCLAGGSCACPPPGADGGFGPETACGDGIDNDCDGQRDCADPDCASQVCSANGSCDQGLCSCPDAGSFPEANETRCGDALDNDCDELTDCLDTASCAGRACGANGRTCSSGGQCVCSGNGGTAQPGGETLCGDTFDNDCDALKDCADTATCTGQPCGANGRICSGGSCQCSGNGGTAETIESHCDDGADNDCDGLRDCADSDCAGDLCAPGFVCGGGTCNCDANGGISQDGGETICSDSADNDCDTLTDCADPGCGGRTCDAFNRTCGTGGVCECTGNGGAYEPAGETTCNDGADNDCDALVDCGEEACAGQTCGANGRVCSGTACVCGGNGGAAQATETTCNDGIDNDCDGLADCLDPNCNLETCAPNSVCCGTGATACKDLSSDEVNCGGCGLQCGTGQTCTASIVGAITSGRCTCQQDNQCPAGQGCSGGNPKLCACQNATMCAAGESCSSSTCYYP